MQAGKWGVTKKMLWIRCNAAAMNQSRHSSHESWGIAA
jgi:hypothetical protein